MISGKWKVRILYLLSMEPLGFAEIRHAVPGVKQQVLSAQLKALERDGIVSRTRIGKTKRPWSRYALTAVGATLIPVLRAVADWGQERLAAEGLTWQAPVLLGDRARPSWYRSSDGRRKIEGRSDELDTEGVAKQR
jgi:DNA-binding HxlR family transcriptional regulator